MESKKCLAGAVNYLMIKIFTAIGLMKPPRKPQSGQKRRREQGNE